MEEEVDDLKGEVADLEKDLFTAKEDAAEEAVKDYKEYELHVPAPTNLMEEQCQEILARMYRNLTLTELQDIEKGLAAVKSSNYMHK